MAVQNHHFLPLSCFLGPVCCDLAGGGLGITPACPNNRATGAEGWAPTDIQYLKHKRVMVVHG